MSPCPHRHGYKLILLRINSAHFKAFHISLKERGVDMSKVSVSKSLMVIRAIEKYGAFSKKKKSMKKRFRHKLHLGPSSDEEKQAEDEKRNEQIEQDAKDDPTPHHHHGLHRKQNRRGPSDPSDVADGGNRSSDTDTDGDESDEIEPDMHDGMRKEDMTDQQRAERAIALIRSAFSKGLKGEKKQVLDDAKQEDKKHEQENDKEQAQDQESKSPENMTT